MAETPTDTAPRAQACHSCRRKKLQCDKAFPICSRCVRRDIDCSYSAGALNNRYTKSRDKVCISCRDNRIKCDRMRPCQHCVRHRRECVYTAAPVVVRSEDIPPVPANYAGQPQTYQTVLLGSSCVAVPRSHIAVAEIWILFEIYAENVDPLLKLFHFKSFQHRLMETIGDLDAMGSQTEALLFAVLFAAVVASSPQDCHAKLKTSKTELLESYRTSLEQALIKSDFLTRPTLPTLQALVLYLITVQHAPLSAPVDVLLAIAIRLATKLGYHQEPANEPSLHPVSTTASEKVDVEMRRRVWWHILALDSSIAEASGTDPNLWEGMWSRRMPSNLDDIELDATSDISLSRTAGDVSDTGAADPHQANAIDEHIASFDHRTDMSFALLRIEMSYAMRQFAFSEHFTRVNNYQYLATTADRIQFLEKHLASINHRYVQFFNRSDLLSSYQRNAVKLILSRHLMKAKKNGELRDVLHNCVMVLEAAAALRKTHQQWAWSLRSYVELDSAELLWKCLASPELAGNSVADSAHTSGASLRKEMDHAWMLADVAFLRGEEDGMQHCYEDQWSRIRKLRSAALSIRTSMVPRLHDNC